MFVGSWSYLRSSHENHMRPLFCQYADANLKNLRVFLAENAQQDYVIHPEPEFHNLAKFEEIIAQISACIILFPESDGSFAELGYFSAKSEVRRKLLVVNDARFQGEDSFISLGPINLIDQSSWFKPVIQIMKSDTPDFRPVAQRLEQRIRSERRRPLNAQTYSQLTLLDKFFSLFEIIRIFAPLTIDGVEHAFCRIWRRGRRLSREAKTELYQLLSILIASDYVRRYDGQIEYFSVNSSAKPFLEIESLPEATRLEVLDLYRRAPFRGMPDPVVIDE